MTQVVFATPMGWLTVSKSSSRGSQAFFWPPDTRHTAHTHRFRQTPCVAKAAPELLLFLPLRAGIPGVHSTCPPVCPTDSQSFLLEQLLAHAGTNSKDSYRLLQNGLCLCSPPDLDRPAGPRSDTWESQRLRAQYAWSWAVLGSSPGPAV